MIRIGHAPRLPRRLRIARALTQSARYLLALGLVFGGAGWLPSTTPEVFWLGLFLAAMVANPWRPKRPARPVRPVSARAVHSGWALRGALAGLPSGHLPPT